MSVSYFFIKLRGRKFGKLDITKDSEIATQYNILSIPTFLFIENGKVAGKESGYIEKDELINKIYKYCGK